MAYTFRKPKDVKHLLEILEATKHTTSWDIARPSNINESQRYFDMYEPIVLVYDGNKLIGAAHGKGTELVTVIDPSDKDITKSIPLKEIVEIKTALKQIELF